MIEKKILRKIRKFVSFVEKIEILRFAEFVNRILWTFRIVFDGIRKMAKIFCKVL